MNAAILHATVNKQYCYWHGHTASAHNSSIISTTPVDLQHIFLSSHAGNVSLYLYLH
jgi:hypothetical protein